MIVLLAGCYGPERHRRTDDEWDAARRAPVPAGNIRIQVETFEYDTAETVRAVASGSLVAEWSSNGLAVLSWDARASTNWRRDRSYTYRAASLLVADGTEGSFDVVQEVPVRATAVIPVYGGAVVVRSLEIVPVGTGFNVRPKKVDASHVDLEITPWMRDIKRGVIAVTELSTRLRVEVGQPYMILQHEAQRETLGTFFFSRGSRRVMMILAVEAP